MHGRQDSAAGAPSGLLDRALVSQSAEPRSEELHSELIARKNKTAELRASRQHRPRGLELAAAA